MKHAVGNTVIHPKGELMVSLLFMIVKPAMVQLVTSERTVCQGDIITFNCTANSNPAIHTYQLYMNGTMVNESSTGVWNRRVTAEGVVVYKCMVNNTIGTAMSMDVSVTVNGNDMCLWKADLFSLLLKVL